MTEKRDASAVHATLVHPRIVTLRGCPMAGPMLPRHHERQADPRPAPHWPDRPGRKTSTRRGAPRSNAPPACRVFSGLNRLAWMQTPRAGKNKPGMGRAWRSGFARNMPAGRRFQPPAALRRPAAQPGCISALVSN